MATRVIDDTKLQNIAVAIQAKDNGGQMTVDEMPTRIANIHSGGGTLISKTITENGVYNASSDNADGYDIVTVNVPQNPNENLEALINNTLEHFSTNASSLQTSLCSRKTALLTVNIPNVIEIPGSCFYNCPNLTSIVFSDNLIAIRDYAFQDTITSNYLNFSLPDSVKNIGLSSFRGCTFGYFKMPKNITSIGGLAFYFTRNTIYDMSEVLSVPTLGSNAFANSTNITIEFANQTQFDEYAAATNWSTWANLFAIKGA